MKKQQPPLLKRTFKDNGRRKVSTVTLDKNTEKSNDYFSKRTVETPKKKVVETDISKGDSNNPSGKSSFSKETKNKSVLKTNIYGPRKDSTYIERTIKPTTEKEGKTTIKIKGYSNGSSFNSKKKTTIPKLKK
jgi:hypothetical protein